MPEGWKHADKPRTTHVATVERLKGREITYDGWTFLLPEAHVDAFHEGQEIIVETVQFSKVTGMGVRDPYTNKTEWVWRKTNQQLDDEHDDMVDGFKKRRREVLEANREDWTAREAALPDPLKHRLERFRENGGEDFDTDGWGYELVISELAVLYANNGGVDDEAINNYAKENGTSGNQHDFAKMLGRELGQSEDQDDAITSSPSALTPLTGDPDYAKG